MEQIFSKLFGQQTLSQSNPDQILNAFKIIFTKFIQSQPTDEAKTNLIQQGLVLSFQFLTNNFLVFKKATKLIFFDHDLTKQYLESKFILFKETILNPPLHLNEDTQSQEGLSKFVLPLQLVRHVARVYGDQQMNDQLSQLIKQFISKNLSQKQIQQYLVENLEQSKEVVIRSLCKVLSVNVSYVPISGIDVIKTFIAWFMILNIKERKSFKAFQNLLQVIAEIGSIGTAQPNSIAIQFIVKMIQCLGNDQANQSNKIFMFFDQFKNPSDNTLKSLINQSLKYIYQQQQQADTSQFDEKLYFRLINLPLTNQTTSIIFVLLQQFLSQSKLQFLVYLTAKSLSILAGKLLKSPQTRSNTLSLLRFFMFGYQMQPKYFIDYCDQYIEVLNKCKDELQSKQGLDFTQELIDYLNVCMSIHSGHPEKYIELQDIIGEIIYDYKLKDLGYDELDKIKSQSVWVPLSQQQEFSNFENNIESSATEEKKDSVSVVKKYKGMVNLGNTCYMNSFLQALYQIKEFREDLLMIDDNYQIPDLKLVTKVKFSVYQLQRLFAQLYQGSRVQISPSAFRVSLPDFFKNYEQHDCSEFAKILLDKLESEYKQCSLENLNLKYLEGIKQNSVQCLECQNVSISKENFIDIGVNFDSADSKQDFNVQDMLLDSFKNEVFENDNKYFCQVCDKQTEKAVKVSRIEKIPDYLIVTINRFYFDRVTLSKKKLFNQVAIQQEIVISQNLFADESSSSNLAYELQSVVIHAGTNVNFGHYYTVARAQDENKWRIFNDANVTEIKDISYLETIQKKFANDTPYMVIYKRKKEDVEMKDEEQKEAVLLLPPNIRKYIENDNKLYIEEEKKKKDQKQFNSSFYKQLQKTLQNMNVSQSNAEDNLRKWYGDFGGPSSGAGGFFGGSGFIS